MKNYVLLASVLSGLLLWAAWPVSPFTFLIFFGFVPILYLAEVVATRKRFFLAAYLSMLIWNICTTWWICNSTLPGGVSAMLANSLLMCIPLLLFFESRKLLSRNAAYVAFVIFWLSFEYIHLNWQLSWPWLTLGNAFAMHPGWVQWYEYTGTSGGSLWILLLNTLLFETWRRKSNQQITTWKRPALAALITIIIPFAISGLISYSTFNFQKSSGPEIVILQPNIDPYSKFSGGNEQSQLATLISLSDSAATPNTKLVIWPETAINNEARGINLDEVSMNPFFTPVNGFLRAHPQLKLFSGIEGVKIFTDATKDEFSRPTGTPGYYYNSYNSAAVLDSTGPEVIYNKSKLVPGVETLPSFLKFMDALFEQFGGTTGGYASQKERTVMPVPQTGIRVAPAICYESIYGEFLTSYVRGGANLLVIITNDGWWANTSGHKQHMNYARLRAIETRRWVARSANTGISCIISPEGKVLEQRGWDEKSAIRANIPLETKLTFFARHGDIISSIAAGISIILLLLIIFLRIRGRVTHKK